MSCLQRRVDDNAPMGRHDSSVCSVRPGYSSTRRVFLLVSLSSVYFFRTI